MSKFTKAGVHTFKRKMILSFLGIGLIPIIIISIFYQGILCQKLVENSERSEIAQLKYMSLNLEKQIEASKQLLGQIMHYNELTTILTKNYENDYEKVLDVIHFNSYVMQYGVNTNIENDIFKIVILGDNGTAFQMGNSLSFLDVEKVIEKNWLQTYQKKDVDTLAWSQDKYLPDTLVFPLSARIYSDITNKPIGWCLIVFSNNIYSQCLMEGNEEQEMFLINNNGQCIGSANPENMGEDLSDSPLIQQILSSHEPIGNIKGMYKDQNAILHYYKIPNTNLTGIIVSSLEYFFRESKDITTLLAVFIFIMVIVSFAVTLYLTQQLIRPIKNISNYIKKVPSNGFQGNLSLAKEDEFKEIVQAINHMEDEIQELMEKQKREVEVRNELEFKVLQNQINPHFLYNTLNSIKWMATLQKNYPIRDMTAALGRLLQNISKGTAVKIQMFEEMSILDDYVLIQNIRYNGKIKVNYHITDKDITQAYILKFTLQPIMENAIFHGIESKEGDGIIDITLEKNSNIVYIHIQDNGVGMTQQQITDILSGNNPQKHTRGLNGIGIKNIQERIQMTYGMEYGLFIESKLGEYTKVTIKIPYERE